MGSQDEKRSENAGKERGRDQAEPKHVPFANDGKSTIAVPGQETRTPAGRDTTGRVEDLQDGVSSPAGENDEP